MIEFLQKIKCFLGIHDWQTHWVGYKPNDPIPTIIEACPRCGILIENDLIIETISEISDGILFCMEDEFDGTLHPNAKEFSPFRVKMTEDVFENYFKSKNVLEHVKKIYEDRG